ncbi:hypothetical protein CI102_3802 [Trichoderma harzianum]|uniref:Uncharacterized protein n=1 Tax=Trichoderma harzianum CBS 226.95 TaxID=983964 RepID=A0A2T4AD18_TRIHA|nr:hypothetical protein M431DRAFT_434596 [Trichoderma harzianum CBS 226.95]PKK50225.1 hypothetical protein CI102_3802 [Trichoderma harzianum]PTB54977.1 hypothetical protein M431DRAFT_434596 [Trichoderma harzianum CBS 226.95]
MGRFHNWYIIISCIPESNIGTKKLQMKEILLRVPWAALYQGSILILYLQLHHEKFKTFRETKSSSVKSEVKDTCQMCQWTSSYYCSNPSKCSIKSFACISLLTICFHFLLSLPSFSKVSVKPPSLLGTHAYMPIYKTPTHG